MAHGINSATKKMAAFSKYAVGGAAAIGATVIAGLAAGTKHTLSMADDLVDVSTQTGIAIADMMRLQQAYKDGGRAASMTGKDIGKMQKAEYYVENQSAGARSNKHDELSPSMSALIIASHVKDGIEPAGNVNAVEHSLDPDGLLTTTAIATPALKPKDLFAFLDDRTRAIILGTVQFKNAP